MTWGARLFLAFVGIIWLYLIFALSNMAFAADTITSTTSTVTVDKTPPTASAPSVIVNNSDVCRYSSSGAIQSTVIGFAAGGTDIDQNCEMLKLSRRLSADGLRTASVALLAQDARVFEALWMAGTFPPYRGLLGQAAKQAWIENPQDLPEGVDPEWLESDAEYYERTGVSREQAKLDSVCADRNWTYNGDPCRNH